MKNYIKSLIAVAVISFGCATGSYAQDNTDRAARIADMQARQTERLTKELNLTDEQKDKFTEVFARYSAEMAALRPGNDRPDAKTGATQQQNAKQKAPKKELTDEEANARLDALFTAQAEQIKKSQARLDAQKKYRTEFSTFLTPQQMLKVFRPQQQPSRNGGGNQLGNIRNSQRGGQGGGHGRHGGHRNADGVE